MKRPLSKRAAITLEPMLTRIIKEIDDRLATMAKNITQASASDIVKVAISESQKASSDINGILTLEVRRVEQTINTTANTSSINNPFNVAPTGQPGPAPGTQ